MGNSLKDVDELQTPLTEQWPNLRFLGLGAWWAWIWLSYNSVEIMAMFPATDQTYYVLRMYLLSTAGIACAMFISACLWKRMTLLVDNRTVIICFGTFASLSTILLAFSVIMNGPIFFILAAIFTGIGTSILCLKVGRIYGTVSLGESLTASAMSLMFAALLYFVGIGMPEYLRLYFVAALPLIAALMLTMRPQEDPFSFVMTGVGEVSRPKKHSAHFYARLVIASAIIAYTAGVGRGIASTVLDTSAFANEGAITVLCIGVIAVFILVAVNRAGVENGSSIIYIGIMVLTIILGLGTLFGLDIGYLSIGKESLWMILSCFMAYYAFRFDLSPVRVFAIGQGLYFMSSTLGWFTGWAIAPVYDSITVVMVTAVVVVICLVMVLVVIFPDYAVRQITTRIAVGSGMSTDESELVQHMDNLYEPLAVPENGNGINIERAADVQYGLSTRELEILSLFAQGRSANWIADSLIISKNTVRSHLRAIYSKLNVHTRQELLDFLDGEEGAEAVPQNHK
ncbi:MAG: helix-turn-helix transcriptional regulator [Eggerthellaceae bacterium]|nr:helix-turn-helix transcriptional regulator [Eggerthellaceae bacterium]